MMLKSIVLFLIALAVFCGVEILKHKADVAPREQIIKQEVSDLQIKVKNLEDWSDKLVEQINSNIEKGNTRLGLLEVKVDKIEFQLLPWESIPQRKTPDERRAEDTYY